MNYYRRYLGDYMKDTMHLSIMEHGTYGLLLDAYYASEKPLPADYDSLYRICRAMSKAEKESVRKVVDTFFPVQSDGLRHNPRADKEIATAQATIEKQRESAVKYNSKRSVTTESTDQSTVRLTDTQTGQPITTNHQPLSVKPPTTNHQPPEKDSCAEPAKAVFAPEEVAIFLPTNNNGHEFPILKNKLSEWEIAYPSVDVPQTLREIRQWLVDNKPKRKTAQGMHRFVNSWLAREQNRG